MTLFSFEGVEAIGHSYCLKLTCHVTLCPTAGKLATEDDLYIGDLILRFVYLHRKVTYGVGISVLQLVLQEDFLAVVSFVPSVLQPGEK